MARCKILLGEIELPQRTQRGGGVAQERHAEQVVVVAERGVLRGGKTSQRRLALVAVRGDHRMAPGGRGDQAGIALHRAEFTDAVEASGGTIQTAGVAEREPLHRHDPRALRVGDVRRRQQIAEHRQCLVESPERHERRHRQITAGHPRPSLLVAAVPRRRGHLVMLGGPLQGRPPVGHRGALPENVVGPGVGPFLAGSDLAQRLLGDDDGGGDVAFGQPGARRLDGNPMPERRGCGGTQSYGGVDVGGGLLELTEVALGGGPEQQERRLTIHDRAEPSQQRQERTGLDRLGQRFVQPRQHHHGPVGEPGVEQQIERVDRSAPLGEVVGQAHGTLGGQLVGSEAPGGGEIQLAGDRPSQRHPCGEGALEEAMTTHAVEQRRLQPGRPGEQPEHADLMRQEVLLAGDGVGADHARRQPGEIDVVIPAGLVEHGGDDADVAVGGVEDPLDVVLIDERCGLGLGNLGRGDRQLGGVEDDPVGELDGFVELGRGQPSGDDDAPTRADLLDGVDQIVEIGRLQRVDIVDQEIVMAGPPVRVARRRTVPAGAAWRANQVFPAPAGASRSTTGGVEASLIRASRVVRGRRTTSHGTNGNGPASVARRRASPRPTSVRAVWANPLPSSRSRVPCRGRRASN